MEYKQMDQWSGALALPEVLGLGHSIHVAIHNHLYSSS